MRKMYLSAPLPFVGQKRMLAKEFMKVLEQYPDGTLFVDLFGGSGLLSHITKSLNRPGGGQSPAFPDRRHCAGDERQSHFAEWAAGRRGDPCSRQRPDTRLRDFCADHVGAG